MGKLCLELCLLPSNIRGHRELKMTGWIPGPKGSRRLRKTCPGMLIDLDKFRRSVSTYMQIVLKDAGVYNGSIDGIFGLKTIDGLRHYWILKNPWKKKLPI